MSDWPDVEGAMRDYLRGDSAVQTLFGNREFFGIPERGTKYPLLTVQRIGGGQDSGVAPLDRPLLQIDIWESKGRKAQCQTAAAAVRDALYALSRTESSGSLLYGAEIIGAAFVSDPETDQPRYVLTVDLTARAVPA